MVASVSRNKIYLENLQEPNWMSPPFFKTSLSMTLLIDVRIQNPSSDQECVNLLIIKKRFAQPLII